MSAKDSPLDRVTGITLGSDDYMVKPFLPLELVTRVRALFRRAGYGQPELETALVYGGLSLERGSRSISAGNQPFSVTPMEFDFLTYMMEHKNQAVSKRELLKEVWKLPDYTLDTRVADDLVKRLRRKLKDADCGVSIETVWGFGFRLNCESEE